MKHILLLLLSLFPFIGLGGEPEIELSEYLDSEVKKTEIPVSHAEIDLSKSVSVTANLLSSFSVSIYDATTLSLLYQGNTYDGYCHFTSTLPSGNYYIVISGPGYSYEGEFEIAND